VQIYTQTQPNLLSWQIPYVLSHNEKCPGHEIGHVYLPSNAIVKNEQSSNFHTSSTSRWCSTWVHGRLGHLAQCLPILILFFNTITWNPSCILSWELRISVLCFTCQSYDTPPCPRRGGADVGRRRDSTSTSPYVARHYCSTSRLKEASAIQPVPTKSIAKSRCVRLSVIHELCKRMILT
jgi:hypothetical protein